MRTFINHVTDMIAATIVILLLIAIAAWMTVLPSAGLLWLLGAL